MKAKKVFVAFCAAMMLLSTLIPVSAAESDSTVIDFGDGYYFVVETVSQHALTRSADSEDMVYGSVSGRLYYETTQLGSATLTAIFDISGSTAVATAALLQGTGMNGWTYTNGGTYCGGNRASGTAIFQSDTTFKQLPLAISCTPDGTLY